MKKKLLCLFFSPPFPDTGHNTFHQYYFLQTFKKIYDVKYLYFSDKEFGQDFAGSVQLKPSNLKKIINLLTKLRPPRLTHYWSDEYYKKYIYELENFKPDIMYVSNVVMMQYPMRNNPVCKIVFYDDESRLFINYYKLVKNFFEKVKNINLAKFESGAFKISNLILTITGSERDYLKSLGLNDVSVLPYSLDTDYFSYKHQPDVDSFKLLFVGNFLHYPNREAVKYICKEIMPGLPKGIRLVIAGRNTKLINKCLNERVDVYENVKDIRPFYWSSSVFVAPLFSGAGLRIKILEAASSGIPIVTTPMGNLGIDLKNEEEAFIINNSAEAIERISNIYNNRFDTAITKNARLKVTENFSLQKISALIDDLFLKI